MCIGSYCAAKHTHEHLQVNMTINTAHLFHLYSDGFSHRDVYNKNGIVPYIFQSVTGRNFQIMLFLKTVFTSADSVDLDKMWHTNSECNTVYQSIHQGFPVNKG